MNRHVRRFDVWKCAGLGVLASGTAGGLGGCNATHVIYAHNAVLGVDLSFSTEGTGRFALGYDRETFAVVPRCHEDKDNDGKPDPDGDAMSLTSVSKVYIKGLSDIEFNHVVATGGPAEELAKNDTKLGEIRAAVYGQAPAPAPAPKGGK